MFVKNVQLDATTYEIRDKSALHTYMNVAAMKVDDLKVGEYARTLGYTTQGDDGGAIYYISATANENYFSENLQNGNFAIKLNENVENVKQYGALGKIQGQDDSYAISQAIKYAMIHHNPVFFPDGEYLLADPIELVEYDGLTLFGSNNYASKIFGQIKIPQNIELHNFHMHDLGFNNEMPFECDGKLSYSDIVNCHFEGWTNGMTIKYFENVNITGCEWIRAAENGEYAIQCGRNDNGSSGANLIIENCLLNGNETDDTNINCKVGILILDCDAVWLENVDIGRFIDNCIKISPQFRSSNHHVDNSYMDVTKTGHNVFLTNNGQISELSFTSTWFASASYISNVGGCGLYCDNGAVSGLIVNGCRFINIRGAGVYIADNTFWGQITSCLFQNIGIANSPGYQDGIYISTPESVLANIIIDANTFYGVTGKATRFGDNTQGYSLTNNVALNCVFSSNNRFSMSANNNPNTLQNVEITDSFLAVDCVYENFMVISPTGEINAISPATTGKKITLWFSGAVTVNTGQGIFLSAPFKSTGNSTLTLMFIAGSWVEVARSVI